MLFNVSFMFGNCTCSLINGLCYYLDSARKLATLLERDNHFAKTFDLCPLSAWVARSYSQRHQSFLDRIQDSEACALTRDGLARQPPRLEHGYR